MVKVSVVVPVYNTEKYLKKCLASIINQTFKEIEVIVINDCSNDNSLNIIQNYLEQDKRIILINKKENKGLSAARNSGIEIARGEYVLHVDGDDWIEKEYIEDVYMCAKRNNADIIITDFYRDFGNKEIYYIQDQIGWGNNEIKKEEAIKNIFLMKACNAVWNKLIKTEIYRKNKISHPEGISLGEDLVVIPRLLYFSKKIIKLDKAYYHYIQNPLSLTKSFDTKKIYEIYDSLKLNEIFFRDKEMKNLISFLKINHLTSWLLKAKYNFQDEKYKSILYEYYNLVNENKLKEIKNIKLKIIIALFKTFRNKNIFILVWKINSIVRKKY